MKLSLAPKFGAKLSSPALFFFPELLQPHTVAAISTVAINVLERCAFNAESQYFIPLFNKIS
jgi:hypothetical protein